MQNTSEILTIKEVAAELRCSRTHVQHAISGKLMGVPRLTHISMGRRKLIRRDWLNEWLEASKLL